MLIQYWILRLILGSFGQEIHTVGLIVLRTALRTTCPEEVMIALETSIEIVTIQTDIVMRIGTVTVMAHARTWIDTGAEIAMMTEMATIPG